MPIMNGVEAVTIIRKMQSERRASKDTKLILVSGDQMSKEGAHLFDLTLTKPVQKKDIIRALFTTNE